MSEISLRDKFPKLYIVTSNKETSLDKVRMWLNNNWVGSWSRGEICLIGKRCWLVN